MCGIVAQLGGRDCRPDRKLIEQMAADIRHRGPDDEGYYCDLWCGLGFRRLSILDTTSAGHQPMFDEDRRYVIVYNGELYNYKVLQAQLEQRGYTFRSHSDTEVVLKAFLEWGTSCVEKFIGMFAFIVVDLRAQSAFAARDHLGIKPLYFMKHDGSLFLASEIKCFRHVRPFELNCDALYEQFFFRYVSGRNTIFKNIFRLPAGTWIMFDKAGALTEKKYYDVTESLLSPASPVDYESVEAQLKDNIWQHTQSDVGYNVQLSGGIDSSYITAVLAGDYGQKLHTYSVTLRGYEKDESRYQNLVARQCDTDHHPYDLDGNDFAGMLPKATWHMDMPIVHTACVFLMELCRHSAENSKVILTGEGADELFGGYDRYAHITGLSSQGIAFALKRSGVRPFMIPPLWRGKGLRKLLMYDFGLYEQWSREMGPFVRLHDIEKKIPYRESVSGRFYDLPGKIFASDQTSYLGSLLERQDKMSMSMSVEARVPYCVHTMFDLVNGFSAHEKIKKSPKYILKKLAQKYFNPDFAFRRKVGFVLPYSKWLKDRRHLGRFFDLLTDTTFKQRGIYESDAVEKAIREHERGEKDHKAALMILIRFEIWHRLFIDRQAVSA